MKMQFPKRRNKWLCFLLAAIVLILLTALPFAETASSPAAGDTSCSESGNSSAADVPKDKGEKTVSGKGISSEEKAASGKEETTSTSSEALPSGKEVSSGGKAPSEKQAGSGESSESGKTIRRFQNDEIAVEAVLSDASELPGDARLCVVPITQEKNSGKYQKIVKQIGENLKEADQTVTGLLAYDIYFSADGTKYEPKDGDVTVTIQYKKQIFSTKVKKSTNTVKVLHLEDTEDGSEVEDVTKSVDVTDLGENAADPESEPSSGMVSGSGSSSACSSSGMVSGTGSSLAEPSSSSAASERDGADTVEFTTGSFSVFAVAGVRSREAGIHTSLTFQNPDGSTDTKISGTYYLYVERSGDSYRNLVKLDVSGGTASASIAGLYDQNGDQMNHNQDGLYPLTDGDGYGAVLFQYNGNDPSATFDRHFRWDDNDTQHGYVRYKNGDDIAEAFTVTEFPGTVTVSNGTGAVNIIAAAKTGIQFSRSDLLSRLKPVLPFAVFADYFDLSGSEVEGCIAANQATICGAFGNTENNISHYSDAANTITVKKIYDGSEPKTFRFGLYRKDTNKRIGEIKTLTLPAAGSESGTVAFDVGHEDVDRYTVHELDGDGAVLREGGQYDGFRLTKVTAGKKETNASTLNWTSYINSFCSDSTGGRLQQPYKQNRLVVGKGIPVVSGDPSDNGGKHVACGSGKFTCDPGQNILNASKSSPMPDFSGILSSMEELSADLAGAIPTDSVAVKNYKVSDFAHFDNNTFDFTVDNGQMLLINIDATGCKSFQFPNNSKLKVNGQAMGGWVQIAPSIVVNVYTRNQDGSVSAYNGIINYAGYMMGTLLAPGAEVHVSTGAYNGRIVACKVYNDRVEIHGVTMGTAGENILWTFVNTAVSGIIALPETGGTGTGLFFGLGGGLILLAAAGIVLRRKRRPREAGGESG